MKRRYLLALLAAAACGGGGGSSGTPIAAFLLTDMSPTSSTSGTNVSPRNYLGDVSAWYFGDGTSAYSRDQFGFLDRMQDELWIETRTLRPNDAVQIVGINRIGAEAGMGDMTLGRDLPCLQDTVAVGAQALWGASDGDLVVLDESNVPIGTSSLAGGVLAGVGGDLSDPAVYEEVKTLLRGGPAEPAPDFGLVDMNTNSPTSGEIVSPRDYVGRISGYYFGAAT